MQQHKAYLLGYNVLSLLLWARIATKFLMLIKPLPRSGLELQRVFGEIAPNVTFAMLLQLAEPLHAALGLTKTKPLTALLQVCSRLQLCCVLWPRVAQLTQIPVSLVLLLAWTLSELCRYPFYVLQLSSVQLLLPLARWLRYSAFIVLYPVGIACEVVLILMAERALLADPQLDWWPSQMPNSLNFEMRLSVVYLFMLLTYAPGSVFLYNHMLEQRSRAFALKKVKQ